MRSNGLSLSTCVFWLKASDTITVCVCVCAYASDPFEI